jgi:HAD superfamily hydrolase (TIGR01662 family)
MYTLFFDLGSTLLYTQEPWPPVLANASEALERQLHQDGVPVDSAILHNGFDNFLDAYYAQRAGDNLELTSFVFLRDLLARNGFGSVPDFILRCALDAMYAVTERNWHIETDAIPTLSSLMAKGYRLGMITNASDENNTQALIDQNGLRLYFEFIISSAKCGIRKPDARIFQLALDHLGIQPTEAVMIGDTLEADILGANQLGIYSIWITRRAVLPPDGELTIQPQAVIASLSDLPSLLASLHE